MLIRIACPSCKKSLRLDAALAGKKIACSGCKRHIRLPTAEELKLPIQAALAGRSGSKEPGQEITIDYDLLASAAVAEEKTTVAAEAKTVMVEFTCPQCDEAIKIASEHAGKRAPCPLCRRIIQVPKLDVEKPRDWREKVVTGPTLAKKEEVKLEGAWGNQELVRVSVEALEEARAVQRQKRKLSRYDWILRGVWSAMVLAILLCGWLMWSRYRSTTGETHIVAEVEAVIGDPVTPAEIKGILRRGLGEWTMKFGAEPDEQKRGVAYLQQARTSFTDLLWNWYMARGTASQLGQMVRLDAAQKNAIVDVQALTQLIQSAPEGEPRESVFRSLCRSVLIQTVGHPEKVEPAVTILSLVAKSAVGGKAWTPPANPVKPGSTTVPMAASAQDFSGRLDCLGILAQELLRAGAADTAGRLIDQERHLFQSGLPIPKQFVAALTAIGKKDLELGASSAADHDVGKALGYFLSNKESAGQEKMKQPLEAGFSEDMLLPLLQLAEMAIDAGRPQDAAPWLGHAQRIAEIYTSRRELNWRLRVFGHYSLVELSA